MLTGLVIGYAAGAATVALYSKRTEVRAWYDRSRLKTWLAEMRAKWIK